MSADPNDPDAMLDEMNGGPAFPANTLNVPFDEADDAAYKGMSLRDYFAARAMNAFLRDVAFKADPIDTEARRIFDSAAEHSYAIADAMLKARQS